MTGSLIKEWYLEHHSPRENKHKFYEVSICQEDMNSFTVYRRYGRIGSNTKAKPITTLSTYEAAEILAHETVSSKRYNNRDSYDLVSCKDMLPVSTPDNRPTPKAMPKQEPFVIEQTKPVSEDLWGCIQVA
ncbi:WGR domain-containing protein [Vibrio sp. 10N.261.46.E12]|uniref:WGR domain-containing protein n=1 Tax=unclassified Vibrio TaxID=2614977 RepID=UPI0009766FD6|nr:MULTISPECIES: WGR domain-containing protein [unclassified Vibrio]OMO36400.1 hypothetical protein BH584_03725 [Vibrio sp. 10N.261.45.E1]PMJ22066.1 hypothetical protein BCU27_16765 [Vibrio sp. 10N.286.45.B6]PML86319.1 hypothetical protein BCT66_14580 [Vibrio sp. 10N.261.49.E11]PMM76622.1 hypothetical protein BCT48_02290 [Vibrio sp. 10N.261.46.F12]PMM86946.1 hypothetical protein BCT46_07205 [Vibrio sp. 10N.261.46.E8]